MTNYRPNICALLTFAVLAASCSPPPGGPLAVAQNPPMPVVVPDVPPPQPQPEPKPEPTPDIQPGISIPAQTPIGKRLIATFCPPHNAEKCAVKWMWLEIGKDGWTRSATTLDALIDSDGRRAIIWAQPGNYRVEVVAACAEGIESYSADFTVGEPKPPEPSKTLKELAGKDAAALAAVYQSMLPLAEQFGVNKIATAFAEAKLGELAKNPAALEVSKRMAALGAPDDPVDVPRLTALLAAVIAELDAPGPAPDNELARLVPDAKHREALAGMYESLASAVHAGGITTTGQFRSEHLERAKALGIVGIAGINKIISERIVAAIGLEDAPLDAAKIASLATALNGIAEDFR